MTNNIYWTYFFAIAIIIIFILLFRRYKVLETFENQPVGDVSYQETSIFDQEYIDPDDNKPKRKRFVNETIKIWNQQTIDDFLHFQNRQNPDILFDMDIIQQQASEKEAKYLLRNGKWPWSKRTKDIYKDVLSRADTMKRAARSAIDNDQTIYNEQAMLKILGLNEKEGEFLLYGQRTKDHKRAADKYTGQGTYGINSGLVDPSIYTDAIQCNKGRLQLKKFKEYNKDLTGEAVYEYIDLDPKELPTLFPGFQFIKQPCNPCVGLEFPYNNSCPFSIQPNKKVSPAWEKMWGLPASPIEKLPKYFPFWIN